jgi:hypothetical protein
MAWSIPTAKRDVKMSEGRIIEKTANLDVLPRIILGSGRSGTTWILDCLAAANGLVPVFEPLHPAESEVGFRYAYRAMAPGEVDDILVNHFLNVATAGVPARWINYRVPKRLLFPYPAYFLKRGFLHRWLRGWRNYVIERVSVRAPTEEKALLIKCIRANLMAGWLTRNAGLKTALIVRHPCAVVESQYRLGDTAWDPTWMLSRYREDRKFEEITSGRYRKILNSKLTKLQALTLNWVIENQLPVEWSRRDGYAVVCYEDLILRPNSAWRTLCDSLNLEHLPGPNLLSRPSQQSTVRSTGNGDTWDQAKWKLNLTSDEITEIQGILDESQCALYTVDHTQPADWARATS